MLEIQQSKTDYILPIIYLKYDGFLLYYYLHLNTLWLHCTSESVCNIIVVYLSTNIKTTIVHY